MEKGTEAGTPVALMGRGVGGAPAGGGATGLQVRSPLRGREVWQLPLCSGQILSPRQTADMARGDVSPPGCSRRWEAAEKTGRSPAGQSCYEQQDGTDVQFIPEVTEVQEGHLHQPELVRVTEELREDEVRGLAVFTNLTSSNENTPSFPESEASQEGDRFPPSPRTLGRGRVGEEPRQRCRQAALSPPSDPPQPCSVHKCVWQGQPPPVCVSQLPTGPLSTCFRRRPREAGPRQPRSPATGWVGQTAPLGEEGTPTLRSGALPPGSGSDFRRRHSQRGSQLDSAASRTCLLGNSDATPDPDCSV